MNRVAAIKDQKLCLKQLDRNIFDLTYTQIHCKQCGGCLMAKKRTHPNKTTLHSFESNEFWDKILADISGPFKADSLGNHYCLIQKFEYVCHTNPAEKCIDGSGGLRRCTVMCSQSMVYATLYSSRIEEVRSEAHQLRRWLTLTRSSRSSV